MQAFYHIMGEMGMPIAIEKTLGPIQILDYLGLIWNFINQVVAILEKKRVKCLEKVQVILDAQANKKKVTVKQIQQVARSLNFICQAIPAGLPFLASLYRQTHTPSGVKCKAGNHKRITVECTSDIEVFKSFLMEVTPDHHKTVPS